ncbi:MAG: HPF/RaiA family ribosome-associated protein [Candidatus Binatus sp.]
MQRPLTITARDFVLTEPMEQQIREKVADLGSYYDRITGCEVVVEGAVRHHHRGGPFRVRIRLTLPRGELEVNRHSAEDLAVAIRDAFDAARRRLEDHVRELRRQVKAHEEAAHGQVKKLDAKEGFGFLETPDGDEIYFHRNSVLPPGFESLKIGTEVRFVPEMGEHGPQASSLSIIRPRHKRKAS